MPPEAADEVGGVMVDIAAAVCFAASSEGRWITGETIQVGGGLTL